MDAALDAQRLVSILLEEVDRHLSGPPGGVDWTGAEEILGAALGRKNLKAYRALLHYEFGRLYQRWNKLSSAVSHYERALDELVRPRSERQFRLIILQELRSAREAQASQQP